MSWLFRPDQWPRTPQDWIDRASRMPSTPKQWLAVMDELSRSPTKVLVDLVESVSAGLIGRRVKIETEQDTIELRLVSVSCSHENPPIAMGAWKPSMDIEGIETVVATATDVTWERGQLDHLRVEAHDVRLETGIVTRLRAAPVLLEGRIGQQTVDLWVDRLRVETDAEIERVVLDTDGAVRVWLRSWLVAEVGIHLEGDEVVMPVRRVRVKGIPLPFAHLRFSERRVAIPPLAQGLRITEITVTPEEVVARGRVEVVREPVWLDQVIRAASTVGSQAVLRLRPPESGATPRP